MTVDDESAIAQPSEKVARPARWPAALRLDLAAEYCGLSVETFKQVCPIKPIAFTRSTRGNRWLRERLDQWLMSLDPNPEPSSSPRRRLSERLYPSSAPDATLKWKDPPVAAASWGERLAKRPEPAKKRRRKSTWGLHIEVTDPKTIAAWKEAGAEIWEDGEWEKLVRAEPMKIRETRALEGFFKAGNQFVEVLGAGLQITSRLEARGYIESAADGSGRHRITPAGEAAWLKASANDSTQD